MKDGFCSLSEEILDISSPNMVHRSTWLQGKIKFELGDLDLILKVTEVFQGDGM